MNQNRRARKAKDEISTEGKRGRGKPLKVCTNAAHPRQKSHINKTNNQTH